MLVLYLKAFHVISMVCWFSGLFYVPRLFMYHVEANSRSEQERDILQKQLETMQRRLWYGITWPAMMLTLLFGVWLALSLGVYREGWFHFKMLFVVLLVLYHFSCGRLRKRLLNKTNTLTSFKLRLFNEIPTLFLFAIVCTVYLRGFFSGLWGIIGLGLLAILLVVAVALFRRRSLKPNANG